MVAKNGHTYTFSFKAWASRPTKTAVKFGMSGPPYKDYDAQAIKLTDKPQAYGWSFQMKQKSIHHDFSFVSRLVAA